MKPTNEQEGFVPLEQYIKLQQEFAEKEHKIEERLWLDATVSQFDNILRLNYDKSTAEFSKIVLDYSAELTKAYAGVFYIFNSHIQIIKAIAGYACIIDKLSQKEFQMGEGIVGQALESKKMIFFEDLPAKNINIKSSTLNIGAASILIIPLVFNEKVFGVIELVFLRNLEPKYLQLLEIVSRNVASMLESITNNELTKHLLKQSQEQAEALRAQEEELRQGMEEMQTTQEELQRIMRDVQGKEAYMNSLIDASKDTIMTIDREYKLVYGNKALMKSMEKSGMVLEKDFDTMLFYSGEQIPLFKAYYERVFAGETFEVQEYFNLNNMDSYYSITYAPVYNELNEVVGAAIFGKDITEMIKAKKDTEKLLKESQQQAEELTAQGEELRQNMEELAATQEAMVQKQNEIDKVKQEEAERARKIAEIQKKATEKLALKLKATQEELNKLKNQ